MVIQQEAKSDKNQLCLLGSDSVEEAKGGGWVPSPLSQVWMAEACCGKGSAEAG